LPIDVLTSPTSEQLSLAKAFPCAGSLDKHATQRTGS